jgi:hypothetical protein
MGRSAANAYRKFLPAFLLVSLFVSAAPAGDLVNGREFAMRSEVISRHGMVGSSRPTGEVMSDGGVVSLESQIPYPVRRELGQRGHVVQVDVGSFGGYRGILFDLRQGVYFGASESRKDGQAAGY